MERKLLKMNAEYKINQFVNHKHVGVCKIVEISPINNGSENVLYYVLKPLFGIDKNSVIRMPVSNSSYLMKVKTKKEVLEIIASVDKDTDYYIADTKQRKTTFESVIGSGDLSKIYPLYIGVKNKKAEIGRLNSMDNMFLSKSEPILFGNFSVALNIPYEEVQTFIEK